MRWNDVVTLLGNEERYQDDEGAWHAGEPTERLIYCNRRNWGSLFMANLRSNEVRSLNNNLKVDTDMMPEAQLEVRAIDYKGERRCRYHDEEYTVLTVTNAGETAILGLARRIGNV